MRERGETAVVASVKRIAVIARCCVPAMLLVAEIGYVSMTVRAAIAQYGVSTTAG